LHNILDTFFLSLFWFGTGRNIWEASHIWSLSFMAKQEGKLKKDIEAHVLKENATHM